MALGGGTFVTQNKTIPGSYINFVSLAMANATLSDRGIATMPLELDWGFEGDIFTVTNTDFQTNCLKIFGYAYDHEKMKGLRDLFKNAQTLFAYRLNGGGTKASNTFAEAKFGGLRGNDLKIAIQKNVDDSTLYDVKTVLGESIVGIQTVKTASELVANDFVTWKSGITLAENAGSPLTGGTNKTVDGSAHQTYLEKVEKYSFNTMGVVTNEDTIKTMYVNFCKRLREELGVKFQVVVYNKAGDHEGIINLKNKVTDSGVPEASLVYWVTGIQAGCPLNKSNTNKVYDGEFTVDVDYTQAALIEAIKAGEYTLHQVGSDVRILEDINSLVTTSDTKGESFKDNQTIRVIDQNANDVAVLFSTKYIGEVPNDEAGRTSLWADIVKYYEQMQSIRAIENFSDEDVKVEVGNNKKSVVISTAIQPVNAMTKLYMTVTVG